MNLQRVLLATAVVANFGMVISAQSAPAAGRAIPLKAPGGFTEGDEQRWRSLAKVANARLSDPRVGIYSSKAHVELVLFVPGKGILLTHPNSWGDCVSDIQHPPTIASDSAAWVPDFGGYAATLIGTCGRKQLPTPVVYPVTHNGALLLLTDVDGYVDEFNATEGVADLEIHSLRKAQPTPLQSTEIELPPQLREKLFPVPLSMRVVGVTSEARDVRIGFSGPPRHVSGYRIAAQVDKGKVDRLFEGMPVWRLADCVSFEVVSLTAESATVQIEVPFELRHPLAVGDLFSTSRKRANGCPRP